MPEIKLGSSKNAKNINLGSKEIEEVRLGRVLVWQNNIAPQIVLTTPQVGEYGDLNFPIGITVASNVDIVFSARDLDPLDTIVSYAVDGPTGFIPVPTTPITPSNPVSGLTFTIPNTLFTNAGDPTTNNVFTVTVTDQRGKDGIYTVTVITVSVPPPTIRVSKQFGTTYALTSNGPQGAQAIWVITQPPETGPNGAGYTAQYSYDNVNWSNYNGYGIYRNTTASCGGSSSVTIYCRSIKTGSTTANGNYASSTFDVDPPGVYFPVSLSSCVYQSIRVSGNTPSQTCGGVISGVGTLDKLDVELYSGSGRRYTGTSFPNLYNSNNGNETTPYYESAVAVRFKPEFVVPSVNGTTLNYICQGGQYRMTATTVSHQTMIYGIRGALGTTGVGSLYDRGPDFRFTTLSIDSPYVSISPTGVYGDPTYAASFNSVGTTKTKPIYGGDYRLAAGGTLNVGPSANGYDTSFETYDTCPTAGTVLEDYCNGTIFTEKVADGNCGNTLRTNQVVGKCGYVPAPSAYFTATSYCSVITKAMRLDGYVSNGARLVINYGHSYQDGTNVTLQPGASATVTIRSGLSTVVGDPGYWRGFSPAGEDPGGTILATSTVFTVGSNIECEGNGAGQTYMTPNPLST